MARIHGKDAVVLLGERDATADITNITPELTAETHDTTTIGDDWLEAIAGLIGWEANFDAFYDEAAAGIGLQMEAIGSSIAALSIFEDAGSPSGSELATNGGFETAGAGGADVFGTWTETAGDGAIADEAVVVSAGSHACKLTAGVTVNTEVTQPVTVVPGQTYAFAFAARGDATYAGRYGVYDVTNAAYIIAATSTGVTAAAYSSMTVEFVAPVDCVSARLELWCPSTNGGIAYFDAVSCKLVSNNGLVMSDSVLTKRSQPSPVADFVKLTCTLKGNGRAGLKGRMLHPLAQETVTGTGLILDNAASSASGGRGNLHVTAITGSWTMKIQHSADAVSWADLITFTQATAGGGATSESTGATGTVNRYTRTVFTEDVAGSCTFAITFSRY